MSTRSLTVFVNGDTSIAQPDQDTTEVAVLYRQCDGYPKGHGAQLAAILKGMAMSNGIGSRVKGRMPYNGMGDLAVRVISALKTQGGSDIRGDTGCDWPGNFYLYPAGTRDSGEEYLYTVSVRDARPYLRVQDGEGKQLFEGTPEKVATWIKRYKG